MGLSTNRRRAPLAVLAAVLLLPGAGQSQATGSAATGESTSLSLHTFAPLLADEREIRSFARVSSGGSPFEDTRVFSMALGDRWRFGRVGTDAERGLLTIDMSGAVFGQFDFDTSTFDLLNADFVLGFPITFRRGRFSGRLRPYHQSSHLGDDYLTRVPQSDRRTFDFESIELLGSVDLAGLRIYGGGEHRFRRTPEGLDPLVAHLGAEGRQRGSLGTPLGFGDARLVGAVHVTSQQESGWSPAWSLRAGIEMAGHQSSTAGRRFALLVEFFDGPSPFGHFHEDTVRFLGVGVHVLH